MPLDNRANPVGRELVCPFLTSDQEKPVVCIGERCAIYRYDPAQPAGGLCSVVDAAALLGYFKLKLEKSELPEDGLRMADNGN